MGLEEWLSREHGTPMRATQANASDASYKMLAKGVVRGLATSSCSPKPETMPTSQHPVLREATNRVPGTARCACQMDYPVVVLHKLHDAIWNLVLKLAINADIWLPTHVEQQTSTQSYSIPSNRRS